MPITGQGEWGSRWKVVREGGLIYFDCSNGGGGLNGGRGLKTGGGGGLNREFTVLYIQHCVQSAKLVHPKDINTCRNS